MMFKAILATFSVCLVFSPAVRGELPFAADAFRATFGDVDVEATGWVVGAASTSVLPSVNGRHDYWRPVPDDDGVSPGTPIRSWDEGPIAVGNGHRDARWVRDDCRATAAAISKSSAPEEDILIIIGTNLYMLFESDLRAYYEGMLAAVGQARFDRLRFSLSSDHNHHGPDTMTLVNTRWYDSMIRSLIRITVEAIERRAPAEIAFASTSHSFGLSDSRDPRLFDRNLNILQARSVATTQPIVTIVNWNNHPEVTLGFEPTTPNADCAVIGEQAPCRSNNRYFTGDFPERLRVELRRMYNNAGEVLYVNGAIGALINPLRAPVWEITPQCPLGDGIRVPPGCPETTRGFRRTYLIGRELARAVFDTMRDREQIRIFPQDANFVFRYSRAQYFVLMTNLKFKLGMNSAGLFGGDPSRSLVMGNLVKYGYFCDPPTDPEAQPTNCRRDDPVRDVVWMYNPRYVIPLPARSAPYFAVPVHTWAFGYESGRGGPLTRTWLKMQSMPGEHAPELVTGVPADFDTPAGLRYYENPNLHAVGSEFAFPGTMHSMLGCSTTCNASTPACTNCMFTGLGEDELGYVVPITDYRVGCLDTFNASFCQGAQLDFPGDGMRGTSCAAIMAQRPLHRASARKGSVVARSVAELNAQLGLHLETPTREQVEAVLVPLLKRSLCVEEQDELADYQAAQWDAYQRFAETSPAEQLSQEEIDERRYLVCLWGQLGGRAQGHYEETVSASWHLAEEWIRAVGRLHNVRPSGRYYVTS